MVFKLGFCPGEKITYEKLSFVAIICAANDNQINGEMQNHLDRQEFAINGLRDDLNDAITNIVS